MIIHINEIKQNESSSVLDSVFLRSYFDQFEQISFNYELFKRFILDMENIILE